MLDEMLTKLTTVVEERRESVEAEKAANAEKLQSWKRTKMLAEDGISLDDLLSTEVAQPKAKKTRQPRAPKYEYRDDNGNMKTWTGQGRMPAPIAKAVEEGATLESFLINPLV
ncbi:H-NS family nucleoid-associated regulatory protein [Plesiomonas shigelloides subsp. oncorhynchi]|nr:H-NS family nucleoid-associated regulatory protein [Plesiomonas shigelloides]